MRVSCDVPFWLPMAVARTIVRSVCFCCDVLAIDGCSCALRGAPQASISSFDGYVTLFVAVDSPRLVYQESGHRALPSVFRFVRPLLAYALHRCRVSPSAFFVFHRHHFFGFHPAVRWPFLPGLRHHLLSQFGVTGFRTGPPMRQGVDNFPPAHHFSSASA